MKKEYHYTISRTDRICLISFVVILLGWELIKGSFPSGEKSFTYISPPSEHSSFRNYKKNDYTANYYPKKYPYPQRKSYEKKYSSYSEEQEQSPPSSPLPIMKASIDELTSMGLSRKVAFNIQKFISAGGSIHSDEDLLKIYGMDSLQLTNALPYIIYGTLPSRENTFTDLKKEYPSNALSKTIDLNQASIEDLESLNGIGTVLAERILKFRDAIGGFLSPDQLTDCYGLTPETFEKIKDQLMVSGSPHLLYINEVNLDTLAHPYLTKKLIKLIKAYKNQHGAYKDATEFRKVYPPDSNWCNKILPYISFEINEDGSLLKK